MGSQSGHVTRTVTIASALFYFVLLFLDIDKCKDKNPPCEAKPKCETINTGLTRNKHCICDTGFAIDDIHDICKGWLILYFYFKSKIG